MKQPNPNLSRNERLHFLLGEQSRVRRSRVRRRNTGLAATMILLVGGTAWLLTPRQPAVQPKSQPQQASTYTHSTPEPDESLSPVTEDTTFRITRVEDRSPKLTTVVQSTTPQRVEFISDLQLFIAMRAQGIDVGLVRSNGETRLAFNDEESRRRFEERPSLPK